MTEVAPSPQPTRFRTIGVWGLRIFLAIAFGAAAVAKLSGVPLMVAEFETIGWGQPFRYSVGAIEAVGVALVLVPRTTFFGSIVLAGVCLGALVAQLGPLKGDLVHVFLLGALTVLTAWLTRPTSARSAKT